MKKVKFIAILLIIIFVSASNVAAKDMLGLIGIGFNSQLGSRDVSSISVKYWAGSRLCLQGMLGFQLTDEVDEFDIGGKGLYVIKAEENMNVYAGGGLGIANTDPDEEKSDTSFSISGVFGVEYFFSGLPNLGFSTELGLMFSDYDDNDSVGTGADTFLTAGIHYYF
ncbi:MAG: hypothetical protein ACMUHX_07810 [bacterium]